MPRVAFKQVEVERLLRAAKAVGYAAPAVDRLPDGRLRLLTEPPAPPAISGAVDLDDELEAWRRNRDDG